MFTIRVITSIRYLLFMPVVLLCLSVYGEECAKKLSVDFYGHTLEFKFDNDFYYTYTKTFEGLPVEQQVLKLQQDSEVDQFIKDADLAKADLHLDGMAYLMLIKKVGEIICNREDENFRACFTYAVLNKAGYDVLLGINSTRITLYGYTAFDIKNVLYVNYNGKAYYDLSFDQRKKVMEEQLALLELPENARPLNVNKFQPPKLDKLSRIKTVPYEYDGSIYFFTIHLNQSLVMYYNDLPDIEISKIYLNYGLSEKGVNTLVEQLRTAVTYMHKEKAVDFVLGFVQGLDYGRDDEVLGKEKFAFPEESLANEFTDCEDRSMLFAYLIREVVHLQSVGLIYSKASHMNVAVESWKKKQDSDFSAYEMDFVVCEPSAKGFKPGQQTMDLSVATVVKW